MTEFASKLNPPAEQRAIAQLIVDTFDAVEVERPTGSGLERARAYADRAQSMPDEPARDNWEQRLLWDADAA